MTIQELGVVAGLTIGIAALAVAAMRLHIDWREKEDTVRQLWWSRLLYNHGWAFYPGILKVLGGIGLIVAAWQSTNDPGPASKNTCVLDGAFGGADRYRVCDAFEHGDFSAFHQTEAAR